jgi:hypothetical protein
MLRCAARTETENTWSSHPPTPATDDADIARLLSWERRFALVNAIEIPEIVFARVSTARRHGRVNP